MNIPVRRGSTIKVALGFVFESIVITHTVKTSGSLGYQVYYYQDEENREVDMVVENESFV